MSSLRDAMSHAALGWVKPELDETLRQVRNEVEYYAEDPTDASRMRICAGYLHQVQGTLRMVELYAPAMVAEELEQLAHAIGAGGVADRDEACATLMRGSVLLPDYLERLQNGHRDIPIVLMPLLNEIRAARGEEGVHDSVLLAFAPDSVTATEAELDHARGSLSGRNRELLDTVGSAVKEELLRIKDALDLHLRTGGAPEQLQTQANELGAVADTLGMMGLGVARGVVVQQRDALRGVVEGRQQIDENLLLDIAGALLYVDASLDDQVAHLGAGGSGEDDPSAVENRRTVEVLAHEAIANFAAAREHFVAFIETGWHHAELQDVPRLLGDVSGALRMLDLGTAADYLRGVQQYIEAELIGRQRVPSGRQLDTLADAMASLEYYLEALRDRRPGREDILDITRSSLEALRYWPLPDRDAGEPALFAPQAIEREPVSLLATALQPEHIEIPVQSAAPAPGEVPVPLPDFTFDPPPATPSPATVDNSLMFGGLGSDASAPLSLHDEADAPLVFAASSAPAPEVPQWDLAPFHPEADPLAPADDERSPTFASFDPVSFEQVDAGQGAATQWTLPEATLPVQSSATAGLDVEDAADATLSIETGTHAAPVFDPVAAEHDAVSASDDVVFRFDADSLDNADDVLSLHAMETLSLDDAAGLHPLLESVDATAPVVVEENPVAAEPDITPVDVPVEAPASLADAPAAAVSVIDIDTIAPIDFSEADAQFFAELSAAAADFNPQATPTPADAQAPVAVGDAEGTEAGFEAGFDDDAENIDEDIREVFLEEFDDELANLGTLLPAWRMQPDNMDRLRPIRRIFHTLKGSGRLVGARTLGEFAWKIEGMLNRVLDGSRPATPAVLAMVDNAHAALPQLNAALRHGQRISVDLQAMQAIADRVGAGEETYYVPLPVAAAPAAPVVEVDGEDEISRILEAEAMASVEAEADADPAPEALGTPANIDSVLREILEAEVEVHQATLQDWLRSAQQAPQPVSDALLRAVHTMNGAFAMTEVPEITAVTGGAESYIKRALAADVVPGDEGVAALDATAQAITATMEALQAEQPRITPQEALVQRLQALAGELPEARWPMVGLEDDDEDLALEAGETGPAFEAAAPGIEPAGPELEPLAADAQAAGTAGAIGTGLDVGELTGSDDLSRYFDAGWPLVPGEGEAIAEDIGSIESIQPVESEPVVATTDVDAAATPVAEADLTAADDLSPYLDARALPVDDRDADEMPVSVEVDAIDLNTSMSAGLGDADASLDDDAAALPLDSELSSLQDEMAAPGFAEPVTLAAALEAGLHVIDEEQTLDDDGQWPVLGLQASELAPGEAEAFAEDADVGGEAAVGEGESADQPSPATVNEVSATEALQASAEPVRFFELEDAPGQGEVQADVEAGAVARSPLHEEASALEDNADGADALDFSVYDRELVDIFVEEGKDLLDHCDGLISELRDAPQDREVLAGLQRDLHTLKGGARMAGINAIGDLGHSIESLLEAVAAGRTEIERRDVQLLERGFDRLHQLLTRTGAHRVVEPAQDLVEAFEVRTTTDIAAAAVAARAASEAEAVPAQAEGPLASPADAPLSAPLPAEGVADEDPSARPQQEQVRVRADLLDRLVNHAGEVAIYRSRLEQQLGAFRGAMGELERTNARLRDQLRRLDLETEAQIVARYQREQDQADQKFDPLELDRFSTLQQLSRALNESAADLGGLQGVLDDLSRQYDSLLQQQSRVSSELQDGLMRARMVPFDGLVPRLRRVVRQSGMDTGKQVHLTLEGTHGELDRNVLDRMVAPLEHMLRNSVAHGLEAPEQRRAAGKPEEGEIAIRLHREGSEIVLEVADDGAGLDREAIRRRAIDRGLLAADAQPNEQELDNLIFASGFTTADQVSQLAGRGVGMDVVRNEVRQLGGSVDIQSVRGQGVRFTLRLPQTLAVTQAVFVQIGETTFAVPVASVSGIGRLSRERFEAADSSYRYSGEDYPLYDLGSLVGQAPARADGQDQVPLLLVRAGDLRAAVAIDQVLGNREIVVKPVGLQIASVPGIYGATITGDGRVVVILDVAPLVRRFLANPTLPVLANAPRQERQVPLVMVVDDSLTMRKVTGRILERHNFEVSVARDGVEALERLEERVPDLMLLDIEMPRMDGYELATAMRADPRYKDVPIVMITSRSGDKHRQRAFEIGVQRYLGKPYQELDLMRNVYDLLGIARVRE
ncbi:MULTISPECIES: Hpt domain-containing protein [Stenotrophomonas maltophilia group]|uniref:Hpt domain-containing protein n=2 Tax=Gammaproteobacteria TaxID=1236 RepID=UPI0018D39836|nr:Hpt domain-containing protein [Stenotrophomonas maltophilia]HDS1302564.1 Hpt domain-containing protein [Stenotrophomonas maltophilia]HDS1525373.1 Hpt domain-containing protein [Stenotrophomonas maltophilia]HDS1660804.1 Hpt domain-containing protein [Stenotrophomonas maltophilia]HDS1674088.1 Hpt domain-containing protein [Stenotrophomonas maltophilia]